MSERLRRGVLIGTVNVVVLAAFIVWWQHRADSPGFNRALIASPSETWVTLREWVSTGSLWRDLWPTLQVVVIGYLIGVVIGIVVGIAVGVSQWAREYADPFLAFFNAMPRILLIPFLVVWLGYGIGPKLILVVSVVVFVVVNYVQAGVLGLKSDLVDNFRALGATRLHLASHVYLPGVALWIVASARVAVGIALQGALVAEFFGSSTGLGAVMLRGQANFRPAEMFAALLVMIAIALVADRGLRSVEHRVTRWMPERPA